MIHLLWKKEPIFVQNENNVILRQSEPVFEFLRPCSVSLLMTAKATTSIP